LRSSSRPNPFFLAPYSPDLNPIGQPFSKTLVRKPPAQTIEQIGKRIAKLLQQIELAGVSTTFRRQDTGRTLKQ
jgi:transposase